MPTQSSSALPSDLKRLQNRIAFICQAVRWMVVIWLAWILGLIFLPFTDPAGWIEKINKSPALAEAPISVANLIASRAVNLAVWAVAVLIGVAVWKLMTSYLQGDIFSETAATKLRRVGQAGLLTTLANVIARPLSLWVLSPAFFQNAPSISYFVPDDLLYLLISGLILSLARVYGAAAEISAENRQFV